jgi:ABC-type transport system involved in multi-copper enzyme maturation permease subunit
MNPVLQKDLLGLLRLKRVAAVQVVFVAVLALLVLGSWPQEGVVGSTLSSEIGGREQTAGVGDSRALVQLEDRGTAGIVRNADRFLLGLTLGQIVLLVLFVPGMAAVAVSGEREQNTLEMLYASRLKPGEIIAGKVAVAIGYPLLLLLTALPFLALLNWRGDVRGSDLLWSYMIIVVTAVFLALVSLAVSAWSRQSATALVISYTVVLIVCGGVLVPGAIMLDSAQGPAAQVLHYTRALSPVAAALSLLRPQSNFSGAERGMTPIWQVFLPLAGAVIVACFAALVVRLRKAPSSSEGFGAVGAAEAERSLARRVLFLIDPKKTPKPFGSWNPLIARERRTGSLRSGRWMIRIFYGCLLVSLGLAVMSLYNGADSGDLLRYVAQVVVALQVAIIALVAPSLTSAAVSTEIENGTWELLRLTPRGGGEIFLGKLLPSLLPALLPVLALLPAYGALCAVNSAYLLYLARLVPVILLAVLFCCLVGLTCSAFMAATARATVTAYLIVAGIFVVPLLVSMTAGEQLSSRAAAYLSYVSPLVIALNELPGGWEAVRDLYALHLWTMAAACAAMLAVSWARLNVLLRQG